MSVSLRELQENFQAYMLNENQNILDSISVEHADAVERIDIYRKGYTLRLLEILEKDFLIFRGMIGEELFDKLARDYIERHPSDHFSICTFSRHFSQFLSQVHQEEYWSEVVAFEWALSCALDASDAPQISIDELGSVAPESWPYIQFTFHPSISLHKFHYNAPQIVYAMMLEQENVPELIKYERPNNWVIWRYDLKSFFESVSNEQVWMMEAIKQEKTFSEICEGLCQWLPEEEVAMYAAGSLRNWIEKGLFSAIKVAEVVEAV